MWLCPSLFLLFLLDKTRGPKAEKEGGGRKQKGKNGKHSKDGKKKGKGKGGKGGAKGGRRNPTPNGLMSHTNARK